MKALTKNQCFFYLYTTIIIPLGNKKKFRIMKMITIQGEQPFSPLAHSFGISASNEGYTLNYSSDGITYTALDEETPAGENHFVVDCPKGVFFKCVGNNSTLTISY